MHSEFIRAVGLPACLELSMCRGVEVTVSSLDSVDGPVGIKATCLSSCLYQFLPFLLGCGSLFNDCFIFLGF